MATGGAERFLARLVCSGNEGFRHVVMSLSGSGTELGKLLSDHNIEVIECETRSVVGMVSAMRQLRALCRGDARVVVNSWLYKANLFATVALSGLDTPHAWNIRQSNLSFRQNSLSTFVIIFFLGIISRFRTCVDRVVYCAHRSRINHERKGFKKSSGVVIANGIHVDEFSDSIKAKAHLSSPLSTQSPVVINIGRYDIQKGHDDFLKCAAKIKLDLPAAQFVLIGRGITSENQELLTQVRKFNLDKQVTLLGEQKHVGKYLSAAHVFLSCSNGEGWPNALAEAMLVGVPVVHTDVGDSRLISGMDKYYADVGDIDKLAQAVVRILTLPDHEYRALSISMSERIKKEFTLEKSMNLYSGMYQQLLRK